MHQFQRSQRVKEWSTRYHSSSQQTASGVHRQVTHPTSIGTPNPIYSRGDPNCNNDEESVASEFCNCNTTAAVLKGKILTDIRANRMHHKKHSSSSSLEGLFFACIINWLEHALSMVKISNNKLLKCKGCSSSQCSGWNKHIWQRRPSVAYHANRYAIKMSCCGTSCMKNLSMITRVKSLLPSIKK